MRNNLEKENKELKEKIAMYEGLPTAKLYTSVVTGLEYITAQINNKKLDFDDDPYAKSVWMMAKDLDKVMIAMGKGVSVFVPNTENSPSSIGTKAKNSKTNAI